MIGKLILIFAVTISNSIFAQKVIKGKIIDSQTKQAIPYVHIGIKGENYGSISQINGDFAFIIPSYKEKDHDNVYFSCIGYEEKIIPIQRLFKDGKKIELNQKTYKLQEVVINNDKKKLKLKKLGGFKKSISSTGESNTDEYGVGNC